MKYTKIILAIVGFLIGLAAFTRDANAQTVSGYTAIDYYEDTNTVDAYSETDEDYDVDAAYSAWVALSVTDQNNNVMGWQSASDDGSYGYAAVDIQFSGSPDSTYTARGLHKAYAQQWGYDYSNWPMVTTIWYDYYNFSDFAAAGIQVPVFYAFLGPGPDVTRGSQQIILGTTHDETSVSTPAGPPDHLLLGNDLIGSTACYGVRRQIDYLVVDSNKHIKRNISVVEDPGGAKTDSCSNLNVTFSTSCFSVSAIFEDDLKTGCPGSGSCGFDVPTDKWKWCNGTTPPTLATLNYSVHYNQISVDGKTTKYKDKTEFFPDGSVHEPH